MTDLLTFGAKSITVLPWDDPVVDESGYDPRDKYAEFFWLPSLGPSALWILRRIATYFEDKPDGFEVELIPFATQMGLGSGTSRQSPFRRAFERLVFFDLASPQSSTALYVRRNVPVIARRQLMKLPSALREMHARWGKQTQERVSVSEMRSRAFQIAYSMRSNGETKDSATKQLVQWHFHPAIAHDAVARAFGDGSSDSEVPTVA
jgi:hypothetical protein